MLKTVSHCTPHIWGAVVFCSLLAAACSPTDEPPITHSVYQERLIAGGLDATLLGSEWIQAAEDALSDPVPVALPYHESGAFLAHEARATAIAFDAVEGQRLRIAVQRNDSLEGRIFTDVLRVSEPQAAGPSDTPGHEVVLATVDESSIAIAVARSGRYIVRLQPELAATISYDLQAELEAALPFPVAGVSPTAIGSVYGDPRDAGRRQHEGVDIFAPQSTPLLAVADGVATAGRNSLGGNVVWLRSDGANYYYAHLEAAAFNARRRVTAGELLGYVGNTGNARTTPHHLHFGIYRRFGGSVDPVPYLRARTFAARPDVQHFSPTYNVTTASALNMRAAPRIQGKRLATLPVNTVVRSTARSGDWLAVLTAAGQRGWVHDDYQREVTATAERLIVPDRQFIYPDADRTRANAVALVEPGAELTIFSRYDSAVLVGTRSGGPIGWLHLTR